MIEIEYEEDNYVKKSQDSIEFNGLQTVDYLCYQPALKKKSRPSTPIYNDNTEAENDPIPIPFRSKSRSSEPIILRNQNTFTPCLESFHMHSLALARRKGLDEVFRSPKDLQALSEWRKHKATAAVSMRKLKKLFPPTKILKQEKRPGSCKLVNRQPKLEYGAFAETETMFPATQNMFPATQTIFPATQTLFRLKTQESVLKTKESMNQSKFHQNMGKVSSAVSQSKNPHIQQTLPSKEGASLNTLISSSNQTLFQVASSIAIRKGVLPQIPSLSLSLSGSIRSLSYQF